MPTTFFRIVRNAVPTVDDFRTAREDGLPLVDTKYFREWAEGVSVYDNLDYALARARTNTTGLGRFVVAIAVPDDGSIDFAKTMRNRRHYTIYASGVPLLALVRDVSVPAESLED